MLEEDKVNLEDLHHRECQCLHPVIMDSKGLQDMVKELLFDKTNGSELNLAMSICRQMKIF